MRFLAITTLMLTASASYGQPPATPGDPETGWVYAQQHCVGCHSQKGPRSFRSIVDDPGMTGTALTVWLTSSEHGDMPHLMLKPKDARDVVAYILSLKDDQRK